MSSLSSPKVDLSLLPARALMRAAHHLRTRGGKAPGPDRRGFDEVLGDKPGSPEEKDFLRKLGQRKGAYRFGRVRRVLLTDQVTGKVREISVPKFEDRVILRALLEQVRLP